MHPIHDSLFRWAFSDGQRVASLLHCVMPNPLARMLAWNGIQKVPVELLDKDLTEKRTDMVWRLPIHGRQTWLYLILEHQSRTMRWMALRIIDYERRVWQWWNDRHPNASLLPPIVGFVISNAPHGWKAPTQLWDLLETDAELEAALGATAADVRFFLEDLYVRAEEDIAAWDLDAVRKLTLLLLKHGRTSVDILGWIRQWQELFVSMEPHWQTALPRFICYILSIREDLTAQRLRQAFSETLGNRAGDAVMTEAERLRAEGRKQGRKQGREQGREQGLAPLLRLYERRLDRTITKAEKAVLSKRLSTLGPDRLGDVVLDMTPQNLAHWLADPNAT
jgi:predicted transposase YdaD